MKALDFACQTFEIRDVVQCSLGITKADLKLISLLSQSRKWHTTEEIATRLHCHLSTVQRSVKRLYDKKVLQRRQKNLDKGGYTFFYRIESTAAVRKLVMSSIRQWVKRVDRELGEWRRA